MDASSCKRHAITLLERGDGWCRQPRGFAHAAFRNAFLPTRLDQIRFDVAMLHPEAVTLEEVSFTGEALHALSTRSLRSLLDGERLLLVRGEPMCSTRHRWCCLGRRTRRRW